MKTVVLIVLLFAGLQSWVPATAADPASSLVTPGSSSLLTDWITVHLKTIRTCKVPSHHTRQAGYTGIALYESIVKGDNNYRSLAGQLNAYLPPQPVAITGDICWEASANAALATMFRFFYPQDPADLMRFDSIEKAWKKRLITDGYSEASITAGAAYGTMVAKSVIEWSNSDGNDKANAPYTLPTGPGKYEKTPPMFITPILPYEGNCRTMVKGSIDNSLPPPPPDFSTDPRSPFYKMVEEVYSTSVEMDGSKKATGLFWDDFPDGKTLTGGGHWSSILKTVLTDRNASLIEASSAYAGLFITMNDAAIGCFKAKYMYNLLRPVTYIQKYMNHPDWQPLIVTPPHPEYPAAHAAVSMSAATILTIILGDKVSFTDNTYAYRGYPAHHFNNFVEAGSEAGMSRFYGGIHYMPSIEAGYKQGEVIARNIAKSLVLKN